MNKSMRMRLFVTAVACIILTQPAVAQSIKDLDFLIGKWQLEELVYPGTDKEYVEKGSRQCSYTVDSSYIRCESVAMRKGKQRTYISNINYNKSTGRFVVTSQFSDYDFRGKYDWILDKEQETIFVISPFSMDDGEFFRSAINFKNKDGLVWEGWSSPFKTTPNWSLVYRETASRIN